MLLFPPTVVLLGPTAVGKSRLALNLASHLRADIVTADSRQVYRYMDIGTAKPTREEQSIVPHFMLDLIEPSETYSAQQFGEEGLRILQRTRARRRLALVVGGTGFYVRALLDGLVPPDVPPDPGLRIRLRDQAEKHGASLLHEKLLRSDPASAQRIHPNNIPRIIRALEIIEHLGRPVPPAQAGATVPALFIGLGMNRDQLRQIADARVQAQVRAGLVEETRLLLEMGYSEDLPALHGFGYRQMVDYLHGRTSLPQAIAEYQAATHRYIRRQMTWFRADSRIQWLDATNDNVFSAALTLVQQWLSTAS